MIELEGIFSLLDVQKKLLRETAAGNTEERHGYLKGCRPHEISPVSVLARDPVLVRSKRRVASFGSITASTPFILPTKLPYTCQPCHGQEEQ